MDELILIEKDGEQPIRIHPLALEDHKRLGWKVAEKESAAEVDDDKAAKEAAKKAAKEAAKKAAKE